MNVTMTRRRGAAAALAGGPETALPGTAAEECTAPGVANTAPLSSGRAAQGSPALAHLTLTLPVARTDWMLPAESSQVT
jgi:hypothetical protein